MGQWPTDDSLTLFIITKSYAQIQPQAINQKSISKLTKASPVF